MFDQDEGRPVVDTRLEPRLGCATNEQMFIELICRFSIDVSTNDIRRLKHIERAIVLAEMLGGLDATEKEYRTVNSN